MFVLKNTLSIIFVFLILFLSGCVPVAQNGGKSSYKYNTVVNGKLANAVGYFPDDPFEKVDITNTLNNRGLYLNLQDTVSLLPNNMCGLEMVAHRGDYRFPENSRESVVRGLMNGYDTIEIDVFATNTFHYILSHDRRTGRAAARNDGKIVDITRVGRDFGYIRHRNKDGSISDVSIPDISRIVTLFNRFANPNQKLNVELKNELNIEQFRTLDHFLKENMGYGRYYYSSLSLNTLEMARHYNPNVYLGFIQQPHNRSVDVARETLRKGVRNDYVYSRYSSIRELTENIGTNRYRRGNKTNWATQEGINELHSVLGSNSGLHLDIRTLAINPNVINIAKSKGMKVQTYTINGNDYHMQRLAILRDQNRLPDGVIMDMSPVALCQLVKKGFPSNKVYTPQTEIAKMIESLPSDANFEDYFEQVHYVSEGLYLDYMGEIKNLPNNRPIAVTREAVQRAGEIKNDRGVKMERSQTITVDFPIH